MTADMNNTEPNDAHHRPAGAGPVQHTVRPAAGARWYCVSREGMATLCRDEADAYAEAQKQQAEYPRSGPYLALRLVDAAEIDRLRETLKRQQASYEREIALDVAAERERWARAFDAMREKTLAAQAGPESELANVMLRQLAELGFGECSRALRA